MKPILMSALLCTVCTLAGCWKIENPYICDDEWYKKVVAWDYISSWYVCQEMLAGQDCVLLEDCQKVLPPSSSNE